jgi:hypothetical protein
MEEQMSFETSKGVKVVNTFEGMGIRDALLRGVYAFGFEKPSAIQQRAILPISQGTVFSCRMSTTAADCLVSRNHKTGSDTQSLCVWGIVLCCVRSHHSEHFTPDTTQIQHSSTRAVRGAHSMCGAAQQDVAAFGSMRSECKATNPRMTAKSQSVTAVTAKTFGVHLSMGVMVRVFNSCDDRCMWLSFIGWHHCQKARSYIPIEDQLFRYCAAALVTLSLSQRL